VSEHGFIEKSITTGTHGRYLVIPPAAGGPAPLLVGFHGYGEDCEQQLERLRAMPESARWVVVSVQALSRFYERRTNRVVACWMTRQDRELAIADNAAYVRSCMNAVAAEHPGVVRKAVFAGFSQGVAMAFRAAAHATQWDGGWETAAIAVGGDIPPELTTEALGRMSGALIARGGEDEWYGKERFEADERKLRESAVKVRALAFHGGHEWAGEVVTAAGEFLRSRHS
jgi:predicted esterase